MVLNHKIPPEKILTLTFSKAAAQDMKTRFCDISEKSWHVIWCFQPFTAFATVLCAAMLKAKTNPCPRFLKTVKARFPKPDVKRIYHEVNNEYISDDRLEDLSNSVSFVKICFT